MSGFGKEVNDLALIAMAKTTEEKIFEMAGMEGKNNSKNNTAINASPKPNVDRTKEA